MRQKLDVSHSLFQFIERHVSTFEQSLPVDRCFDAAWAPIEEPDANCSLQVRDNLRYSGLRHPKVLGALGHAAPLHNGEEDMEIAQFQAPADAASPVFGHRDLPIWVEPSSYFPYIMFRSTVAPKDREQCSHDALSCDESEVGGFLSPTHQRRDL